MRSRRIVYEVVKHPELVAPVKLWEPPSPEAIRAMALEPLKSLQDDVVAKRTAYLDEAHVALQEKKHQRFAALDRHVRHLGAIMQVIQNRMGDLRRERGATPDQRFIEAVRVEAEAMLGRDQADELFRRAAASSEAKTPTPSESAA